VIPGLPLVDRGPYRWFRHPNYVAVVVEGIALPTARRGVGCSAAHRRERASVLTHQAA